MRTASRNRPISGGRDLSRFRLERLPELHSTSPAGGYGGTVHGCPLCLALPVGDLCVSVIAAVLLLVNRYVPLAVAVLAPVIVNILFFHALMAPSGLPLALFVAVLWGVIFVDVRPVFAGLFQSRLHVQA
jgi:hypothetical protein